MTATHARASAIMGAARTLADRLLLAASISRATLTEAMTKSAGGSDFQGAWQQRDSFEALEVALSLAIPELVGPMEVAAAISALEAIAQALPTQTVRSEDQIQFQQFSTPPALACLAVHLARLSSDDMVLEPSAGTGIIAALAKRVAGNLVLNELEATRADLLEAVFPGTKVYRHDGANLNARLSGTERPSVVLMNPPFSVSQSRGKDKSTAARHLRAALDHLLPGGRIVAIMPDWFSPTARNEKTFRRSLEGARVVLSLRLDKGGYAKHGTGIAVRVLVIDKVPGEISVSTINRGLVSELFAALPTVPLRATLRHPTQAAAPRPRLSLFRSVKTGPARPVIVRAPQTNQVRPVDYEVLAEPAAMGEQRGVYADYRPSRLVIADAGEHPTHLVESAAMASIAAPKPCYVPSLPERTVTARLLSAAQLETVIYAGEAWSRDLHGRFSHPAGEVALKEDPQGALYRTGFFLGDGTGAGKGRQAAACILDQWLKGNRRHIWISKNAPLLEDAQRDWTAIGGLPSDILDLARWKIGEEITAPEGILFVPYGTLRSSRVEDTRLDQVVRWAGEDFEGVIVFDEAHEMGGVAGGEGALGQKQGSLQGIAGVVLQNTLPRARVLYASATGASDVNNLAYAVRLGLWGPGTAFATREQFISEIRDGGIAAMELVARDLKASGLYLARALSFAGVEYDILRHDLTSEQIAIYDTYCEAWTIIHQNLEAALELTGIVDGLENKTLNSGAKAAARSHFEGTKQRFFGQVLLSLKLPSIYPAINEHLGEGDSVVVQLVSTAESILNRRLDELEPAEREALDIAYDCKEYVVDYLTRAFPTRQMEEYKDELGDVRSRPMWDEAGNPVHNPQAEAARADLIEHICAMPPIPTALDALLEHYGVTAVAEVTGRSKRLVRDGSGQQRLESRSPRTNLAETNAFMTGAKRILVFSDAGGTGRSYHASLDAMNQQRRVHFLLEPGWRADRAIQGLGRTHRTHQACPPLFRPVTTDCKGEARFTSTIARRLDALGALTRGQRQTGGQGMFDASDNLESIYAKHALHDWYGLLATAKLKSTTLSEFQRMSGLELTDQDGVLREDLPPIQRWLNRILAMKIAVQNAIFDEFLTLHETRVSAAKEAGTFDIGVETVAVEACEVLSDTVIRTDPVTGATSHLLELSLTQRRKVLSLERILKRASYEEQPLFLRNDKSGKVALAVPAPSHMDGEGHTIRRYELVRPLRSEYLRADRLHESAWEPVSKARFSALWEEEYAADESQLVTETVYLATGLLLPIWGALPKEDLTVNRIVDKSGASWLGRHVHDLYVDATLEKLGVARKAQTDPARIAAAILGGGTWKAPHPLGFTIRTARVNRSRRIEIVEAEAARIPELKAKGCFTEIIAYKTRVFVPVDKADQILASLIG
ncbi:strawberry notch-like NTP hydrolase domain-containing protein [Novosphingobium sp. ERW19]|uniref:strawberry notch-like NTP hydrolase domain-containing protein n=1 Tax=Novosphingobium sp. ERW19 TaxID=2726186 RepID=UPI001457667D|nr:strawberry notch family protein [Novosphingobium sp. ERW19]NLR40646.1 methylase [Novosphingobium sp. ERW19]